MAIRIQVRDNDTVKNSTKTTLRQSSQRQGNCMNRSFGSTDQANAVTGNMSRLQAAAQPSSNVQREEWAARHFRAANAAVKITAISSSATHEMMRLKASWSASLEMAVIFTAALAARKWRAAHSSL